jgi:hypothetical protein
MLSLENKTKKVFAQCHIFASSAMIATFNLQVSLSRLLPASSENLL